MIWHREEYLAHCRGQYVGREMLSELFGLLVGLEDEWRAQGATPDEINLTAFDWDYVPMISLAANCGAVTGLTPRVLEETAEHILSADRMGRTVKLCKGRATLPLPIDHPVRTSEDWERIRHWYAFREDRIDYDRLRQQARQREAGGLAYLGLRGAFDEPRQLMGEEALCIALYEDPELIEDILATVSNLNVEIIRRVAEVIPIDNLGIHEDMAGKSGPLVGPSHVREFFRPYYRAAWDCASSFGTRLFSQDSDGNMNAVIDAFIDCGVNLFYPCEPAAGMDIVQLRAKYGNRICFKGGIDKHALRHGKEAIEKELTYKMNPSMLGQGGIVFALDHRIPGGVSIDSYRYYARRARELLGLPAPTGKRFCRMAF